MNLLRRISTASLLGAGILLVPATFGSYASAQSTPDQSTPAQTEQQQNQTNSNQQPYRGQDHDNIQTNATAGEQPTRTQYTEQQLLTSTVHQAWLLSGKNEANFFEIVEQLADISAHNRNVQLPDSEAVGRRMGEYIKREAKKDTDQLLYAIVDKAVVYVTSATPHPAGDADAHDHVTGTTTGENPQK